MTTTNKDPWATEEVSDRDKLLSFICKRVREGATRAQLLPHEIEMYIDQQGLRSFLTSDVSGMIDWAIRKIPVTPDAGQPGQ